MSGTNPTTPAPTTVQVPPLPSSSKNIFKPTKPTFGDVVEVGADVWAAWTGGEPKSDWSGLKDPTPKTITPNQYRASSISSQAKALVYRVQGLDAKFTRSSDLQTFQKKVMKHLVQYGLDTITYIEDPTDSTKVVSVVSEHARFNIKDGVTEGNALLTKFDKYDHENVRDAKEFLCNSVDAELETQLYENCKDDDSFVAYWLNLIHIVRSVSIDRFDKIKNRIKSRKINDYPGQSVELIVTDYLSDWKDLHGAGLYDQNLTMTMLNAIMEAGGATNEDFRYPLRDIKLKLNKKLLEVRHLSYPAAHQAMVSAELDVQSVTKAAKEQYRQMYDDGKWSAAVHAKDSKAMNKNFGSVNVAETAELRRIVNALVQSAGGNARDKSKDKCNNCGKTGHWASSCPEKKSRGFNGTRRYNSGDKSARNNPGRGANRQPPSTPRTPPPKDGESEIQFVNGKKSYWCAKCNRWTISHGTDSHKSKEELAEKPPPSARMARVNFDLHPSVFAAWGPIKGKNDASEPKHGRACVGALLMTLLIGSWAWYFLQHSSLLQVMGTIANQLMSQAPVVMSVIRDSWVSIVMSFLSGAIGFGSAYRVYCLSEEPKEPKVRYRTGPKYLKKVRRMNTHAPTGRRNKPRSDRPIWVPPNEIRGQVCQSRRHHERFNNVPRPYRYDAILTARIHHVRKQTEELRREIKQVEQTLQDLRRSLKEREGWLSRLTREQTSRQRPPKSSPVPTRGETNRKGLVIRNPGTLLRSMTCAMANLINLSDVSSTQPANPVEAQPVLFDSGANCCVTNREADFSGSILNTDHGQTVDGIGKGLKIHGEGVVAWTFLADNGMYRTLRVPCYYIPSANTRIASVQEILKAYPNETITMNGDGLRLSGNESLPSITVPYCSRSNLPFAATLDRPHAAHAVTSKKSQPSAKRQPSLTSSENFNLSEPEKELLRWHYRLGHIGVRRIQWMFRQGILSTSEKSRRLQSAAANLTHGPLCTACQYAKQRRRTTPGSIKKTIARDVGTLKRNQLFPGQETSLDHFHCNPLGRLLNTFGKERSEDKYKGGCIMVDHASGFTHAELQSHLNSHETLKALKGYEAMCAKYGVIPQTFLSDNGTSFSNAEFRTHLEQFRQTIRHSTVGAHHSNGIAERNISTVMSIARTLLHHQAIHWPDVADVELWPLAVLHAVFILNRMPREDNGVSPLELFSRRTYLTSKLHDFHVWGCPVYVLDGKLSDGHKLPRWKPRSSRHMYVGTSQTHGESVPLVLCLETGKITSQYHAVFDDWFQTVEATATSTVNFEHDDWYKTFGLTEWQYVVPDDEGDPQDSLPLSLESQGLANIEDARAAREQAAPTQAIPNPISPAREQPQSTLTGENEPEPLPLPQSQITTPGLVQEPDDSVAALPQEEAPPPVSHQSPSLPRETTPEKAKPAPPPPSRPTTRSQTGPRRSPRFQNSANCVLDHYSRLYETLFVGKAKANSDPDTYTWEQAMGSPHRENFLKAAQDEIDALVVKGTWKEDLKANATPNIIPSQWVFKIKRTPDGEIKKFKGRICLRGDLQEDDGQSNHSPVAAWSTVRVFLTESHKLEWVTTTIDFSNAFVQSYLPVDEPLWMHVPRGYKSTRGPEWCLRLIKSLYGHKRAPLFWFEHCAEAFKKLGLVQSKHDPCLWYGPSLMIVQYVDDCGISAPTQAGIDKFVDDLRQLGLELTQEGSFAEFLGIKFMTLPDGSVECTQKGLITKTLDAAGMTDCNPNSVPAALATLGTDKEGVAFDEAWSYRAICGMLLYLSTNTRPDISFAVSQVCRFGHDPKRSHASAVKTILRYLKKTADQGLIVKPNKQSFHLDLYVDADFCGLFGREDCRDPNSVRSRTGYLILLGGWPIVWKSQLQPHLSQSTLEAEYSALSASLKVFLPLRWLIDEMIGQTRPAGLSGVRVHATVFEDNQSTFLLVQNQRITNRTKYFLAKWHWFWDAYNRGEFTIVKCPTDQQFADFLTKPQPRAVFETNRGSVQGW